MRRIAGPPGRVHGREHRRRRAAGSGPGPRRSAGSAHRVVRRLAARGSTGPPRAAAAAPPPSRAAPGRVRQVLGEDGEAHHVPPPGRPMKRAPWGRERRAVRERGAPCSDHAAVGLDDLAVHPRRLVGREEGHDLGHFLGPAHAVEGEMPAERAMAASSLPARNRSVSTGPGATPLTRTPRRELLRQGAQQALTPASVAVGPAAGHGHAHHRRGQADDVAAVGHVFGARSAR